MTVLHTSARSAYMAGSVGTATPEQLLIMLFERLVLDTERALRSLMKADNVEANNQLLHAQAIVTELQATLEVDGMPAGRELMALYGYLNRRLIQANVQHDQRAAKECVVLARHLCETWKHAAAIAAAQAARTAPSGRR